MIAICTGRCSTTNVLGVRYDPAVAPRKHWRCPNCSSTLRGIRRVRRPLARPGDLAPDSVGCIVSGRVLKLTERGKP